MIYDDYKVVDVNIILSRDKLEQALEHYMEMVQISKTNPMEDLTGFKYGLYKGKVEILTELLKGTYNAEE